ncbi:MAG: uroporphyrinogen decarboxylase family protein [Candidatus Omnitrophica bacterium]|nr:uroporphyrinogen decarboxylase family protein [Candidatus Omnitrophota bacterium]
MSLQRKQKGPEEIGNRDIKILKELACKVSEISTFSVHFQTISEWKRNNDLIPGRPMVWINEVPWHEIEERGDIEFCCENGFARAVEANLKTTLYMWENARSDMVVEPVYRLGVVINDTGYGISSCADYASTGTGIISRHFIPQIKDMDDINKIKFPEITVDWESTEKRRKILQEIFGRYLNVEIYGAGMIWFAPWDWLVMIVGVEETLMALATRPEFAHALIDRFTEASIYRLEQLESLKLLSPNNGNFRIGSGGLGYTSDLPQISFSTLGVDPKQQWGFATSQIFSEVSPAMHKEFALNYEKKWLEQFGLTYYGCCEPLHNKIHILQEIENLRKISISPRADVRVAAEKIKNRYVISYKPNPAVLAGETWEREFVKNELKKTFEIMKENGCIVEMIMKDISTIRRQPQRLKDWSQIAMEVVSEF